MLIFMLRAIPAFARMTIKKTEGQEQVPEAPYKSLPGKETAQRRSR
jgi:hypothetical protein